MMMSSKHTHIIQFVCTEYFMTCRMSDGITDLKKEICYAPLTHLLMMCIQEIYTSAEETIQICTFEQAQIIKYFDMKLHLMKIKKSSFIHFSSKFKYIILILNSSKLNGGGGQGLHIKGRYLAFFFLVFSVKYFHDTHKLSISSWFFSPCCLAS